MSSAPAEDVLCMRGHAARAQHARVSEQREINEAAVCPPHTATTLPVWTIVDGLMFSHSGEFPALVLSTHEVLEGRCGVFAYLVVSLTWYRSFRR
ncbi:hypothetical protein BaRGS_00020687 [Batillaria attramentaria]|uniref:Uncharacterized protein n=1 Tax=Batillaria attramentaria TaxID=370345 RepID=A0ABD0JG67_9CAEN